MMTRTPLTRRAAWFAGLVVALLALLTGTPALAASDDTFDRFDVNYVVGADGVTHVTETIVLRFGPSSGRHGLERLLVTREPAGADEAQGKSLDVVFPISNVAVTSPDGVSTQTSISESEGSDARHIVTRIRVGSSDRTISAPTATYVLSYDQRGLLRGPDPGFDEFYVDALGPGLGRIAKATVTVGVPQGVQGTACWAGAVQTKTPCTSATTANGVATFTQAPLAANSILTVDAKITKGAAGSAQRLLVESALAASERQTLWAQIAGGVGALITPFLGWLYYRPRSRDDRFAGLPPGTVPRPGSPDNVEPDHLGEVPVAFSPPKLPLMYAGYLLEGGSRIQHLTATLIGLATGGALQLQGMAGDGETRVAVPLDRHRASDAPSLRLYDDLFGGARQPVAVEGAGTLLDTYRGLQADARQEASAQRWFKRIGRGAKGGSTLGFGWIVFVGFFLVSGLGAVGTWLWAIVPITVAWIITMSVVWSKLGRGQRTGTGRAWTDQIEGFRTYLTTAEAEQLKFEEGEDIFSKYLPWAVLFGVAERWTRVCERAVALGRMAEPDSSWYGGGPWNPNIIIDDVDDWDHTISTAATPEVVASTGGSGFGGGSGFSGGGFSGGGSGGGGGGSW